MIATANGEISYYQFSTLINSPVKHAVFGRQGGTSAAPFNSLNLSSYQADNAASVQENQTRAYGIFQRSTDTLVHAHLIHDAGVLEVNRAEEGQIAGHVDGLISNHPGCGLTMNYADCGSIFLYDPIQQAIGLGHAGWKGAVSDLPGALVRAMEAAYGSDPRTLIAGLGPCIGVCCYEVDEPVISAVKQAFSESSQLLQAQTNSPRPHFDLAAANLLNLKRAGVQQIEMPGLCTACRTDLFFSHRAEKGKTGRFGALLILNERL